MRFVSLSFTIALLAVIGTLLILRLTVRRLPIKALARPIHPRDAALVVISAIGLFLHCAAMFNQGLIEAVPGTDSYVSTVNGLGVGSAVLYAAPAALLVAGLHGQRRLVSALVASSLLAVGITMYDHGSVAVHLTCIYISVVLLSLTATLLITRVANPRRPQQAAR